MVALGYKHADGQSVWISLYVPRDSKSPESELLDPVIILVSISGCWPSFRSSNDTHTKHPIQLQYWRDWCLFPNTNCSVTCQYVIKQLSHYFFRVAAFNYENRDPYMHMHFWCTAPKPRYPQPWKSEIWTDLTVDLTCTTESTYITIRRRLNTHYSSCLWAISH